FCYGLQAASGGVICVWPLLRAAFGKGQQREGTYIIRIDREQPIGGIGHFGRIIGLLISAHQRLQRVLLDNAVGILRQESFQAADLGGGILLLHRADIRVVLGWILNLFFLRLGWCSRLSSRWCGSGLLCSGGLRARRLRL